MKGMEFYHEPEHLSPSSVSQFARCPRLWFYSHGCGLGKAEQHIALKFGEAFHAGMGLGRRGDYPGALKAFLEVWEDRDEFDDPKRNAKRAISMYKNFFETHKGLKSSYVLNEPPKGAELLNRVSDDEMGFAFDVGIPIPIVGRCDAVGRDHSGKLWGIEYKTSSQLGSWFLMSFENSPQVLTYTLALSALSGERCAGVVIDGILVAKVSCNSMGLPISVNDVQLEEIIKWYQRMWLRIYKYQKAEDFPCNFHACTPYAMFGMPGYTCPFSPLCKVEDWTTLKGMFVTKEPHVFLVGKEGGKEDGEVKTEDKV